MYKYASMLVLSCTVNLFSQIPSSPDVLLVNRASLQTLREEYRNNPKNLSPYLSSLLQEAQRALSVKPVSVVDKEHLPPSGDKHDYFSIAPYWWPDPTKKDGLPYIRRDGQINPERYKTGDREKVRTLNLSVFTLALAHTITGDETYAAHAVRFLQTWFLNPSTRMNPNLNYAQAIRGMNEGRGTGIIDTHDFIRVIDGIRMLEGSRAWTKADSDQMKQWFAQYLKWLSESNGGKEEAAATNNHGSLYDVQCVCIALFIGKTEQAKEILREVGTKRIALQIEPDGSQPLELARTKAYNYSLLNLEGLIDLATLGQRLGVDLWSYKAPNGGSIRKAIDFLIPSTLGKKKWKWEQIIPAEHERMIPILRMAAKAYNDPAYTAAANTLTEKLGTSPHPAYSLPLD